MTKYALVFRYAGSASLKHKGAHINIPLETDKPIILISPAQSEDWVYVYEVIQK